MSEAVQGRGMHQDSLRGGGAGLPIFAHQRHGRLHGQGARVHGHQGRVPNVSFVAKEVTQASTGTSGRISGRTSCKKLGRGNLGREASPPRNAMQERGTGPNASSSLEGSSSSSAT
jgi:hypothetical protein